MESVITFELNLIFIQHIFEKMLLLMVNTIYRALKEQDGRNRENNTKSLQATLEFIFIYLKKETCLNKNVIIRNEWNPNDVLLQQQQLAFDIKYTANYLEQDLQLDNVLYNNNNAASRH